MSGRFFVLILVVVFMFGCSNPMGFEDSGDSSGDTPVEDSPETIPFENQEIVESLEAYLTFEEQNDIAGENEVTVNGADSVEDRFGQALEFNGTDDYVEIPHSDSVNFGAEGKEDYTVSVWVYPYDLDGYQHIISKLGIADTEGDNGPSPFELFTAGDRNVYYVKDGTGSDTTAAYNVGETTISADEWQHFVLIKDGDYFSIYRNGVRVSYERVSIDSSIDNDQPITIGQRGDNKVYFNGMIDEVGLFNRALSSDEVMNLHTSYNGTSVQQYHNTLYAANNTDNNLVTQNLVSMGEPEAKYQHQGFDIDLTHYGALAITTDPASLNVSIFGEDISSVTFIYEAGGVEEEFTLTDSMLDRENIWDENFPDGIDFYDADGDGEFLNLDNYPDSDDYPILAFKEVVYEDETTWTNPDL